MGAWVLIFAGTTWRDLLGSRPTHPARPRPPRHQPRLRGRAPAIEFASNTEYGRRRYVARLALDAKGFQHPAKAIRRSKVICDIERHIADQVGLDALAHD